MGGSTSHKRRNRRNHGHRPSASNTQDSSSTARVLDFTDRAITNGRGYDLLTRVGWNEGQPLGASSRRAHTSVLPIPIVVRPARAGLGSSPVSPSDGTTPMWCKPVPHRSNHSEDVVFDPLRPRCRYNPSHVVASLKALQKHEANCACNPSSRRALAASAPTASPNAWTAQFAQQSEDDDDEDDIDDENFSDLSETDTESDD